MRYGMYTGAGGAILPRHNAVGKPTTAMNKTLAALAICFATLGAFADTVEWAEGNWFDGQNFVPGTRWSVDGVMAARRPARIDRVVNLGGRHVVPAFGDAHHHGIDGSDGLAEKIQAFLEAGIFYVKNPNVIPDFLTPAVRAQLNRPGSIDVAFSNGGLTSTGGHPAPLHNYLATIGVFKGLTPADMENRAYFFLDNEGDIEQKWPRILAGKPDFLKAFVLFTGVGKRPEGVPGGIDPAVLASVAKRARGSGLRVTAHIDTVADFRAAVLAGVDEINHLPQPDPRHSTDLSAYVIDTELARLTASRGITVVTTASTTERLSGSRLPPAWLAPMRANQVANIKALRDAGVRLAIGSDGISGEKRFVTARDEVQFLKLHGMADNLALLQMWARDTPRTIFPDRRLGDLAEGCEASFLVLAGDPLEDFAALSRITLRVQRGQVLPPILPITLGR